MIRHGEPTRIEARQELKPDGIQTCESVEAGHSSHDDTARILDALAARASRCGWTASASTRWSRAARPMRTSACPPKPGYVEKIWDHAAGSIVAREAGAVVTDITGAELDFAHGRRLETNRGIICASQAIHHRIIDTIAQLGIAAPVV
jgi:3'(2'), 5'-bisphosphate nucleotidase